MLIDPSDLKQEAVAMYAEVSGNGIATSFCISSYRTMTIEQFKQEVVPNLKSSDAEGPFSYYVLRDLSEGSYLTIMPDGVIEYKVDSVRETEMKILVDNLLTSRNREDVGLAPMILNCPFPVYSYAEKDNLWEITIKTPETRFKYRHEGLFRDNDEEPFIYMPPLLYTVRYSGQAFRESRVCLLSFDSVDPARIVRAHLPLPNIWPDTKICVGSTHVENASNREQNKTQLLLQSWDLFLNGRHNFDLLDRAYFPENLDQIFEKYELKLAEYMTTRSTAIVKLHKLLKILEAPGRWEELEWIKI